MSRARARIGAACLFALVLAGGCDGFWPGGRVGCGGKRGSGQCDWPNDCSGQDSTQSGGFRCECADSTPCVTLGECTDPPDPCPDDAARCGDV